MPSPFTTLTSSVAPLPLQDIDTDMIIPAQFLTSISKEGYGENLFKRLREQDPTFVLNDPKMQKAQILVTRSNFGCGSSREHAVWALLGWGFRAVIAPSFADIFFSNSLKNGFVPIQLPEETVEKILKRAKEVPTEITIDLPRQKVLLWDDSEESFNFDPFRKDCIINGYDDVSYIQAQRSEIDAFYVKREKELSYSTLVRNNPAS